jgi:hypothetical protein
MIQIGQTNDHPIANKPKALDAIFERILFPDSRAAPTI